MAILITPSLPPFGLLSKLHLFNEDHLLNASRSVKWGFTLNKPAKITMTSPIDVLLFSLTVSISVPFHKVVPCCFLEFLKIN